MNIICKKEGYKLLYYNLTTDTWENNPRKATLIKDIELVYKIRNELKRMNKGDGIVKYLPVEYVYTIWVLGANAKEYQKTIRTQKELNEKEQDQEISNYCGEIMAKYNINLALWGINYIRKEYKYGAV